MLNPPFFLDSALESRYPTAYGIGISVCQHGYRNITTTNDYFKRYIFLPIFFSRMILIYYFKQSFPFQSLPSAQSTKCCTKIAFRLNLKILLFCFLITLALFFITWFIIRIMGTFHNKLGHSMSE